MRKTAQKKKTKKSLEVNKAFNQLVGLYEIADTMEENGWDLGAKHIRVIADKVCKFILNQI